MLKVYGGVIHMTGEEQILQKLAELQQSIQEMKQDFEGRFTAIDERLAGVDERLAGVDERLARIEEKQEEQSGALNALIEWADDVQVVVKIPFGKAQ
jgi:septal ring factor EnvC (AmiA/AmiB activator)